VAVLAVVAGVELVLDELLLLPHAATPTLRANSATADSTLAMRDLDLLHLLTGINASWFSTLSILFIYKYIISRCR